MGGNILSWLPKWTLDCDVNKVIQLNPDQEALGSCRAFLFNDTDNPLLDRWTLIAADAESREIEPENDDKEYQIPAMVAYKTDGNLMDRFYLLALSTFPREFFKKYRFTDLMQDFQLDADWRSILQCELSFVENNHLEQYLYGTLLPEKSVLDANNFNETALKLVGQLIDSGFPESLIDVHLDPSTNLCTLLVINSN
jgi:hypothetical protein